MFQNSNLGQWLVNDGYGEVTNALELGKSTFVSTYEITTEKGGSFFLKFSDTVPEDFFHSEAFGLNYISEKKIVRVPQVINVENNYLLLEKINATDKSERFWQEFGHALATLHREMKTEFGFEKDNYCGMTLQPNCSNRSGYDFYATNRYMYQAEMAYQSGLITVDVYKRIETLCQNLDKYIPESNPVLLHGDLWYGNLITDSRGEPVVIDPAPYYGWAEADLAMTRLFGGFRQEFYDAYSEVSPIEPDFSSRVKLYNLYHLLNHLNLFGEVYLDGIINVLREY